MNPALTYLFFMQAKNRVKLACLELRHPGRLLGVAALVSLIVFLVRHREHEIFGWLTKAAVMSTLLFVLVAGSLIRGLMRRGMAFEPADVEFLFTGPFSERHLIAYRLLAPYLSAVTGALVFTAVFGAHLQHPWLGLAGVALFQIICFHLTAATALYAGSMSDARYERLCSMALKCLAVLALVWIYVVTPLREATWLQGAGQSSVVPEIVGLLFYPLTPGAGLGAGEVLGQIPLADGFVTGTWGSLPYQLMFLGGLTWGVTVSLSLVYRFKDRFVESSMLTTTRLSEERQRVRAGGSKTEVVSEGRASRRLPGWRVFQGAGAIVWKNLVVAGRSRRQMMLGTLGVGFIALSSLFGRDQPGEIAGLMLGLNGLGFLTFVLQPVFRFDLRRDTQHLVEFRALPFSSVAFVLAEIATPVLVTFLFQVAGLLAVTAIWWKLISQQPVMLVAKFGVLNLFFYLTAGVVVNGVWNIHYLLAARRSNGVRQASGSGLISNLTMVFLTCFHIIPGMWLFGRLQKAQYSVELSAIGGMGVQLALAILVVLVLASLNRRLEFSGGEG